MKTIVKTALITGAAKRIGRELALHLAKNGWGIAIHYHNSKAEAEALSLELQSLGVKTALIAADLSSNEDIDSLIANANQALDEISLLINNASTFEYDHITSVTAESWQHHLTPNLWAPTKLSQDFAKQANQGLIINIIDQRVWNLTPHYLSYTVSKSGLWALTQTLSMALAPRIRVNAIGPGPILQGANQTAEQFAQQCRQTPLQIGGQISDICAATDFFIQATSVTGQMIATDGGQHLGWAMPVNHQQRED